MGTRQFTAGLFLGLWAGSLGMAALGFELQRRCAPLPHRTLPAPADARRAPAPGLPPADLIPPQRLPTRPGPGVER